ncbi:MAG: hypothetical protein HOP08_05875 [Cyclobacteriaceae bacterium]|nr:hypothetical protein [Cyclobacteriaceae bacterium]
MVRLFALIVLVVACSVGVNAETSINDIEVTTCQSGKCDVPSHLTTASVSNMSIGLQANSFFSSLFDTSLWPDRWNCGVWTPLHGWIYILSDLFIWMSYFAIPLILGFFLFKKGIADIPFKTVFILFIVFILACGLTHLMDAAIFWWPAYKLSALLRFITAVVSVVTVVAMVKVIPHVLDLQTPAFLERQIKERTKALVQVNEQLGVEMIERKKTSDHLSATNAELMAFSYSVSHDLRSPLRSIHGFSQVLMEDYADKLDVEGKDHLKRICAASSRMGELIDDMLKLSKISQDQVMIKKIDLSAMVQEVVSDQILRTPSIKASFDIEEGIEAHADSKLLKIAIENLVDNAIKYSSKVSQPMIQFGKIANENIYFIRDNGAGFDMKFADKLFGAFQRLHVGEFDGSGIGLATVKRIILKHGGNVWADARINEGATFFFSI